MQHYWLGSKLLASDVRTATRLLNRVLGGHTLTRRERKQLLRTVTDVLRLVRARGGAHAMGYDGLGWAELT